MKFQDIYEMENLEAAWQKVRGSKSPPGVDQITIKKYEQHLQFNLKTLQRQIREETYQPLPVMMFYKSKKKGMRGIGLSAIRDKVVQQAILKIISPCFEKHFLPCCYAYRPGKSALIAVNKASKLIRNGYLWMLQMDVSNFFDSMNHTLLLNLVRMQIDEQPLIRLLSRLLKSKIYKEMGLFDITVGSQQGSGLSPLLSNIYMSPVDRILYTQYGESYLRFSDDIAILQKDQKPLEIAKIAITRCLKELELDVNDAKNTISHLSNGVSYLGYFMDNKGMGPSKKSVNNIQKRLEQFGKLRKTDDIFQQIEDVKRVIRGWHNYYKTLHPLKPKSIICLIGIVEIARDLGEEGFAKDLLKQSNTLNYQHPDIGIALGNLFLGFGMNHSAMRTFGKTLQIDPNNQKAKAKIQQLQDKDSNIHQSVENIRTVLHQSPSFQEGYKQLVDHYVRLGLFGFAEKAHQKLLEIDAEYKSDATPKLNQADALYQCDIIDPLAFLQLFQGNDTAHACQWIDEQGRWGFMRMERPISKTDIQKHLTGDITLGIYPVTEDDRVHFIVFDIDTAKRRILESSPNDLSKFRREAHEDILRLKSACKNMGIRLYIEDSGYKGRHGWLFFDTPFQAGLAQKLGQRIMNLAGGPSDGIIWELFPMGKSDRHESIIKLPLGINRKNNRRCFFLTESNTPVHDQCRFLSAIQKNSVETIKQMITQSKNQSEPDIPTGLKNMINKCQIIRHLISKASDTNYLTHYERLCLLYTLTFAGEDGNQYLHQVISKCINYSNSYTNTQIHRRKENPISCAKIEEYFPDLTQSLGCHCKFRLPRDGYPSPVLYLLEFEIRQVDHLSNNQKDNMSHVKNENPARETKMYDNIVLDFEKIFSEETRVNVPDDTEQSAPEHELKSDTTPRINASETKKSNTPPPEHSSVQDVAQDHKHWQMMSDYLDLCHQKYVLSHKIIQLETDLNKMFDNLVDHQLKTPIGTIHRIKKNGDVQWVIQRTDQ
jgi:group II intron reverse transcriptase/maturase